jgi:hypothetical protein
MESYDFWRDVAERVVRNLLQTLTPILAVMVSDGSVPDVAAVALACVTVVAYTVLKNVAGVSAGADSALWVQLVDRAASAAAATLIAFVPEALMTSWASWASVDWTAAALAAGASAALAVVSFFYTPPALARGSFDEK